LVDGCDDRADFSTERFFDRKICRVKIDPSTFT
jgi:hypothetical protein